MMFLDRPATPDDDKYVIQKVCKKSPGKYGNATNWSANYDAYQAASGNPWIVNPAAEVDKIQTQRYELYDNRRNGGPLKRIRQRADLLSCPICGSGSTGALDHYLPRTEYPEYSIMRSNLVPACSHCNSGAKGTLIKGSANPERFAHPYFDTWLNQPLWYVKFHRPFEAITFDARSEGSLDYTQTKVMDFHLANVLDDQFHRSMSHLWSTLPNAIDVVHKVRRLAALRNVIASKLKEAEIMHGQNAWETAFYRGLMKNRGAIQFLYLRIQKLSE